MKLGRAWGLSFLAGSALAVGCATATPYDGSVGDDAGSTGDDASPALDGSSHHDSGSQQDSGTRFDASPGMDATSQPDTSTPPDSSAPDTSTPPRDASTPDTSTTPDSSTTCSAQNVSGYSPVWVPPTSRTVVCTTAAINAIYTGCLAATATTATCTAAQTSYSSCYGCTFTQDTASAWGPVIIESNGTVRINEGGCVALADSSQATCGHSLEAKDGCDDAACKAVCNVTDQATFTAYQSCVTSAEGNGCAAYASSASTCASAISVASAAYTCVSGASFQALYNQVVPVFCGP